MSSVRQDLGRQLLTAVRWQRDDAEAARLVAAGADMMFDSGDGAGAPLRWAARNGLADSVVCLLRHRADPDAPDACGGTPLIFAAWGGHVDVCELLLRFGASLTPTYGGLIQPTGATVGGLTAHEWAKEKGQRPVSALLGDKARVAALHGAALLEHRPPPRPEGDRSPSAPAPTSSPTARRGVATQAVDGGRGGGGRGGGRRGLVTDRVAGTPAARRPASRRSFAPGALAAHRSRRPPGPALMQETERFGRWLAVLAAQLNMRTPSSLSHLSPRARARAPPPPLHPRSNPALRRRFRLSLA